MEENLGLSQDVTATILASKRDSTVRIYNSTWKMFNRWCSCRALDPLMVSHKIVLDFLQDWLKAKLRLATLKHQVAVLDLVLSVHGGRTMARHLLVQKFLKGAVTISCRQKHRFPTWKFQVVLHTLTKSPFEPLHDTGLKWVRLKTIFLVAITSARRTSKLGTLSCHSNLCSFHNDKVVFCTDLCFFPKASSKFRRCQEICLPSFCPLPWHH